LLYSREIKLLKTNAITQWQALPDRQSCRLGWGNETQQNQIVLGLTIIEPNWGVYLPIIQIISNIAFIALFHSNRTIKNQCDHAVAGFAWSPIL